jgi:hypothetical protein
MIASPSMLIARNDDENWQKYKLAATLMSLFAPADRTS